MTIPVTDEQREAVDLRDGPLFVSAGAGSGKTRVLVERFVASVVEDGVAVDRILAITFTERAAAEMRSRVRARLLELGGLEAAARLRLRPQVPEQVELEPANGGPHAHRCRGDPELALVLAEGLDEDRLGLFEVVERHPPGAGPLAQPTVGQLEHRVRVAAADQRLGVGLERLGVEQPLHEPLHRAVGVRLERGGRQAVARC